jgi:adenylate kinase family enzyme
MARIVVFGTTGSGKSTLAETMASRFGLRAIELDSLYWLAGWKPVEASVFRDRVEFATRGDNWVAAGNYSAVRDIVWGRADTLVWLDLPFPIIMAQLLRRTIRRISSQEDLWGTGNHETFSMSFLSRESILLWAVNTHGSNRATFIRECKAYGDGRRVIRLRGAGEVRRFLSEYVPPKF